MIQIKDADFVEFKLHKMLCLRWTLVVVDETRTSR